MSYRFRFVVTISAVVCCLSVPLPGQGQERVQYSLRGETELAGAFLDPLHQQPMLFNAAAQDGVFTLQLDLYAQSVTVRYGEGELRIYSSRNTARAFSTLSDEERQVLRSLAALLDKELETQSAFQASIICMIRKLGSWPTEMPLYVLVDSMATTVGEVSVPMEEIREANRQAMDNLGIHLPAGDEAMTKSIISLCRQIGKAEAACYPTSLIPYTVKCESVLLGGTSCTGRCGTLCNGLCTRQRYTQDCFNHDRCADVFGITHRYCNFIFASTFDDCAGAPSCVDFPGVWIFHFNWTGYKPGASSVYVNPNRKFTSNDGAVGTWTATDTKATLTIGNGCEPVYTGTLSGNRQTASGTMKCRTHSLDGTWSAAKTNGILPAPNPARTTEPAPVLDRGGAMSGPPD